MPCVPAQLCQKLYTQNELKKLEFLTEQKVLGMNDKLNPAASWRRMLEVIRKVYILNLKDFKFYHIKEILTVSSALTKTQMWYKSFPHYIPSHPSIRSWFHFLLFACNRQMLWFILSTYYLFYHPSSHPFLFSVYWNFVSSQLFSAHLLLPT